MIASVRGRVASVAPDGAVIEVGGVGLSVSCSPSTLANLRVGDRVRINHHAKPNYLHGQPGTVTGWAGQNVIVQLDQPVGRFTTGQLRCPPLILEPLPPERRIPGCYAAACLRVTW